MTRIESLYLHCEVPLIELCHCSAGELSERARGRLASLLSGDTWQHLAQLLDLDYMVPCLAKESQPAQLLLHPDNMKVSQARSL